jgi:hypothetical protein
MHVFSPQKLRILGPAPDMEMPTSPDVDPAAARRVLLLRCECICWLRLESQALEPPDRFPAGR